MRLIELCSVPGTASDFKGNMEVLIQMAYDYIHVLLIFFFFKVSLLT